MSKEVLKASQFGKAQVETEKEALQLNEEQLKDLESLYQDTSLDLKSGSIVTGTITNISNDEISLIFILNRMALSPAMNLPNMNLKN